MAISAPPAQTQKGTAFQPCHKTAPLRIRPPNPTGYILPFCSLRLNRPSGPYTLPPCLSVQLSHTSHHVLPIVFVTKLRHFAPENTPKPAATRPWQNSVPNPPQTPTIPENSRQSGLPALYAFFTTSLRRLYRNSCEINHAACDLGSNGNHSREGACMWDISMIAIGLAFFAIAIAYVRGCDRLRPQSQHKEAAK
jgi:hypothetical protein